VTKPILILGGTGVFGTLIAEDLSDLPLVLASRSLERARAAASRFPGADARAIDLSGPLDFSFASIVIHCAGPYQGQDLRVVEACDRAGAWYVDIADAQDYLAKLKGRPRVLAGMSTIPALVVTLARGLGPGPVKAYLYLGNRNEKGAAAIQSLLEGIRRGAWREREAVRFPFGTRPAYTFESADPSIAFKVGFELDAVNRGFVILRELFRAGVPLPPAGLMERLSGAFSRLGEAKGCLLVEVGGKRAWVTGETRGQRMATLPAALAARLLWSGRALRPLPDTFAPDELEAAFRARGFVIGRE
jgi:saccharopine dehydrogenase-like protein